MPVGLLEQPAAVLNWRTPAYVGRNDLETLFASDHPADWVRRLSLPRDTAMDIPSILAH